MKSGYLIAAAGALLVIGACACAWYLRAYPWASLLGQVLAGPGGIMLGLGILSTRDDGY